MQILNYKEKCTDQLALFEDGCAAMDDMWKRCVDERPSGCILNRLAQRWRQTMQDVLYQYTLKRLGREKGKCTLVKSEIQENIEKIIKVNLYFARVILGKLQIKLQEVADPGKQDPPPPPHHRHFGGPDDTSIHM